MTIHKSIAICVILFGFLSCSDHPVDPSKAGDSTSSGTVKDINGNTYHTVKIGNQTWMVENLKVTKYRNGDSIPKITTNNDWVNLNSGAYCDYDNIASNSTVYGHLYNGYAARDSRNIAPTGWHVSTDQDWKELEIFLGMSQNQADTLGWRGTGIGGKLKEAGTTHWESPNTGANNSSGFTALPSGYRSMSSGFFDLGKYTFFWTSSGEVSGVSWYRDLHYQHSDIERGNNDRRGGYSVRCIKDL